MMKRLTLTRFAYSPLGTFGELVIWNTPFRCFTVERPWVDANRDGLGDRTVSCIPEGVYPIVTAVHHPQSPNGYPCYLLQSTRNRSAIHIHIANTMYDLEGCIGLGNILGATKSTPPFPVWSVLNSATTFKKFMDTMAGDPGILEIKFTTDRP
jgi:uncharacterized protein DUF5675